MNQANFFVSAPKGLEKALFDELHEISQKFFIEKDVEIILAEGGVSINTSAINFNICYEINLHSRIASRVFWLVGEGFYRTDMDIFNLAKKVLWHNFFSVDKSIRVDVSAIFSPLKSIAIAGLRTKDAICDIFREVYDTRPDVAKNEPDIRIRVFLEKNKAKFYLDTSGEPLFKRGYRFRHNSPLSAPIRENLASGLLRLINWQENQPLAKPLLDPFCGSGTFAIEAIQMLINKPSGIGRKFAFEKFSNFQEAYWKNLLRTAHNNVLDIETLPVKPQIFLSDKNFEILEYAKTLIKELDYQDIVTFYHLPFQNLKLENINIDCKPILIANPPYGERMGDTNLLFSEYQQWGSILKHQYAGWRAGFISADPDFIKGIALKPQKKYAIMNGDLSAKFYDIPLFAGARKETLPKD